jgi:lipoprotein-anchoring transpeptidase ErfK/SrfK
VHIEINIGSQRLTVFDEEQQLMSFYVATALKGVGEVNGSEQTPRGWHVIRAKIGADQPVNSVFVGRRPTGEIYSPALGVQTPERDWILTRILWLSGLEPERNRMGTVDTMRRYIYIHGCPDEESMGIPSSHGCIKMHNQDVIRLFDTVPVGTRVLIQE